MKNKEEKNYEKLLNDMKKSGLSIVKDMYNTYYGIFSIDNDENMVYEIHSRNFVIEFKKLYYKLFKVVLEQYEFVSFQQFIELDISCPDLPQLRLHDMRTTYATIAADLEFKQNNLKSALGHSDFSTTQKYYISKVNSSLQQDVMKLEEAYAKIG